MASSEGDSRTLTPLFSFGVITDVQYGLHRNAISKAGTKRYYKDALNKLRVAVMQFRNERVAFVVHLGDIIDGQNRINSQSDTALERVLDVMSFYGGPVHHVLGNHCLYNSARPHLLSKLKIPSNDKEGHCAYYSWVHQGFRFVVLDGYDISTISWPSGHPKGLLARRILSYYNKNTHNWNSPAGMEGLDRRFVAFGGGIGVAQFRWLEEQFQVSRERGERVVLFSHQALHPESADELCLLWNYDRVLGLINEYADTVVATFSGHAHRYGHHRCKRTGIHFRVLEAILEAVPGKSAFGVVDVYDDRLELRGHGVMKGAVFRFSQEEEEQQPGEQLSQAQCPEVVQTSQGFSK